MIEYQEISRHSDILKDFCDYEGLQRYLERANMSSALKVTAASIKADSWVGVIKYKNLQIEILPKLIAPIKNIKGELSDDEKSLILNNLTYMLAYTKKLNIKSSESAKLSHTKNPFLEVLIREYANSLFDCLKRLTPKNYIREEGNLNFLRGKLKFNENIKYNCANKARFYCEYDEYSENNILNQLFLYVAQCLYTISCDCKNKQLLKFIIDYFCDIKFIRFNTTMCKKIKLTRQHQLFDKPFKLAKMFVENSSVDISRNKFENVTLLWDMDKLFEEFIYQLIRRKISEIKVKSKPRNYTFKNAGKYTEPDIVAEINGQKIIIDTKYKEMADKSDLKRDDSYQVGIYSLLNDEPGIKLDRDSIHLNKLEFNTGEINKKELKINKDKPLTLKNGDDTILQIKFDGKNIVIEDLRLKRKHLQPKAVLLYPKVPETDEFKANYVYNAFVDYEVNIRTVDFINLKDDSDKDGDDSKNETKAISIKDDLNRGENSTIIQTLKAIFILKNEKPA